MGTGRGMREVLVMGAGRGLLWNIRTCSSPARGINWTQWQGVPTSKREHEWRRAGEESSEMFRHIENLEEKHLQRINWSQRLGVTVLLHFDTYGGPTFIPSLSNVVPIPPITFEWTVETRKLSRQQLPLLLRYAITIHKCQGQTLEKAVIDIGK